MKVGTVHLRQSRMGVVFWRLGLDLPWRRRQLRTDATSAAMDVFKFSTI
jgi:hypothetical protein